MDYNFEYLIDLIPDAKCLFTGLAWFGMLTGMQLPSWSRRERSVIRT